MSHTRGGNRAWDAVKGRPYKYLNLRRAGLFVAEGDDGVDAGGAASRDGCGEDCGSSEDQSSGAEDQRVVAFYLVELASQKESAGERCGNANRQAQADLSQRRTQHQTKDTPAIGAKGHTNADFVRAPSDGIRGEAIQAEARENQRQRAE